MLFCYIVNVRDIIVVPFLFRGGRSMFVLFVFLLRWDCLFFCVVFVCVVLFVCMCS